jgi:hypothetical protein
LRIVKSVREQRLRILQAINAGTHQEMRGSVKGVPEHHVQCINLLALA